MSGKRISDESAQRLANCFRDQAYPLQFADDENVITAHGLTKRQHYACLVYPALISKFGNSLDAARAAWDYADSLIATENEGQK